MNWRNKNKKIILLTFTGLILLVGVIVISVMMLVPIVGCTLVGCIGGINVELSGR